MTPVSFRGPGGRRPLGEAVIFSEASIDGGFSGNGEPPRLSLDYRGWEAQVAPPKSRKNENCHPERNEAVPNGVEGPRE